MKKTSFLTHCSCGTFLFAFVVRFLMRLTRYPLLFASPHRFRPCEVLAEAVFSSADQMLLFTHLLHCIVYKVPNVTHNFIGVSHLKDHSFLSLSLLPLPFALLFLSSLSSQYKSITPMKVFFKVQKGKVIQMSHLCTIASFCIRFLSLI